jgi:hypothetical protein
VQAGNGAGTAHVAVWHIASFRGDSTFRSLSKRSGHWAAVTQPNLLARVLAAGLQHRTCRRGPSHHLKSKAAAQDHLYHSW